MTNREEIERRRTFAIISHPDAGKTTLTEKLLLYGGAINQAGSVKGKQSAKHAVSDWMDIEKQRGISVTSSVLQFNYAGKCVNILDTPGHQDFSEDTYRTLMAADSAVMVIDAAKGVEAQTIKLFKVCTLRHIPIFTFINKMDREARDPFELMENIEEILGIKTYPMNWPIGCGKEFKGVFDRNTRKVLAFSSDGRANGVKKVEETEAELGDAALDELLTPYLHQQLVDEIELLDGAAEEFDLDRVLRGELSPVFFGSALTNFGVEPFLENFLRLTPTPLARVDSLTGETVDPCRDEFSAFIFKIQANMNKAHRDRIAFMRICSGKFERGMEAYHVQEGKNIKLATGTQLWRRTAPSSMKPTRRHHRPVRPGHLLHRRHPVYRQEEDRVRRHPHLLPRTLCPHRAEGHHEAQAVRERHGADRSGGRYPDLPRSGRRHGRSRGRRRRRAAAGSIGVPSEHRVQRRDPDAAAPLRAAALGPERPRHLRPA